MDIERTSTAIHVCKYNVGVYCEKPECWKCGWNPTVSEKRLERQKKRFGIVTVSEEKPVAKQRESEKAVWLH